MAEKILVVDDNEDLRRIVASMLTYFGYEISEAATGSQAIEKAIFTRPSLILMDIDLPDITGLEAAQLIRNEPRTAHIPIIGCSAHFGEEFKETALRAGMVDYLEKPVRAAVIRAKLEQFIVIERDDESNRK
jgi:CheY-like chemotaxis protein